MIYYVHFSRYSGILILTKQDLRVNYYAPWMKPINIKLDDILSVDYGKGYYDLFSNKPIGNYAFPQYCYDRLIIELNNAEKVVVYVDINTRIGDFDKFFFRLRRVSQRGPCVSKRRATQGPVPETLRRHK